MCGLLNSVIYRIVALKVTCMKRDEFKLHVSFVHVYVDISLVIVADSEQFHLKIIFRKVIIPQIFPKDS